MLSGATLSRVLRNGLVLLLLGGLTSCAGNQALEQAFSADPNSQRWGNPTETQPPTVQLPPELAFPQASPLETKPLPNGGLAARWQVNQPPQAIQGFYQQRLSELGWQLQPPTLEADQGILQGNKGSQQIRLAWNTTPTANGTEFTLQLSSSSAPPSPEPSPVHTLTPQTWTDLAQAPATLQPALEDLARLGLLSGSAQNPNQFQPNQSIDRGTFARWLVTAHNRFYADRPARQIRLANPSDSPLFTDVTSSHPDFPYIQGLAAAGYLPSALTGNSATLFRPQAPLTRETLLQWKVPLDSQRSLTTTAVDRVEQTWGFKDSQKISPEAVSAVAADFQSGDLANIRRIFGTTLLLQPQKPVTRAEAAAALWYFGNQASDGLSARDLLANESSGPNGTSP